MKHEAIYNVVCAACKETLGIGSLEESDQMGLDHIQDCTATGEQYQQAVIDVQFRLITERISRDLD